MSSDKIYNYNKILNTPTTEDTLLIVGSSSSVIIKKQLLLLLHYTTHNKEIPGGQMLDHVYAGLCSLSLGTDVENLLPGGYHVRQYKETSDLIRLSIDERVLIKCRRGRNWKGSCTLS